MATLMGWLKMSDDRLGHEKLIAAGALAELLDDRGMLYAAKRETDGFIPYHVLPTIAYNIPAPKKKAAKLCAVGRWRDDPEQGGWWIHDYLEYNPSSEEREAKREAARERMRKAREEKEQRSSQDVRANTPRSSPNPVPVPHTSTPDGVDGGGATDNGDQLFEPPPEITYTRRLAYRLRDEHGFTLPTRDRRDLAYLDVLKAGLSTVEAEHEARSMSLGVIADAVEAITGEKLATEARGHMVRLVNTYGGQAVLEDLVTGINSGAGLREQYRGDPLALTQYAHGILKKRGAA